MQRPGTPSTDSPSEDKHHGPSVSAPTSAGMGIQAPEPEKKTTPAAADKNTDSNAATPEQKAKVTQLVEEMVRTLGTRELGKNFFKIKDKDNQFEKDVAGQDKIDAPTIKNNLNFKEQPFGFDQSDTAKSITNLIAKQADNSPEKKALEVLLDKTKAVSDKIAGGRPPSDLEEKGLTDAIANAKTKVPAAVTEIAELRAKQLKDLEKYINTQHKMMAVQYARAQALAREKEFLTEEGVTAEKIKGAVDERLDWRSYLDIKQGKDVELSGNAPPTLSEPEPGLYYNYNKKEFGDVGIEIVKTKDGFHGKLYPPGVPANIRGNERELEKHYNALVDRMQPTIQKGIMRIDAPPENTTMYENLREAEILLKVAKKNNIKIDLTGHLNAIKAKMAKDPYAANNTRSIEPRGGSVIKALLGDSIVIGGNDPSPAESCPALESAMNLHNSHCAQLQEAHKKNSLEEGKKYLASKHSSVEEDKTLGASSSVTPRPRSEAVVLSATTQANKQQEAIKTVNQLVAEYTNQPVDDVNAMKPSPGEVVAATTITTSQVTQAADSLGKSSPSSSALGSSDNTVRDDTNITAPQRR